METLYLVIPCYNEEENIRLFYKTIVQVFGPMMKNTELVFVNDGSTDGRMEHLHKLHNKKLRCGYSSQKNPQRAG